jgi:hypothetical protein
MKTNRSTGYAVRMRSHLTRYKREVLEVLEDGVWVTNGETRTHILPAEQKWLNILPSIRSDFVDFFAGVQPPLKLHRDFHHLNSSQAMAFNLFFSWFNQGLGDEFLESIGCTREDVNEWHFEHVPDPEEFTNLDFWIRRSSGREVHIEVKLTEGEFGTVRDDSPAHIDKLARVYRPRLAGKSIAGITDDALLRNYQLMRILSGLDISRGDEAIVIAPAANTVLADQFSAFQMLLMAEARDRIRLVALESLIATLRGRSTLETATIEQVLSEFSVKYLPDHQ